MHGGEYHRALAVRVMTPERLQRIRAVYEAAAATPVAARQALLDRHCEGDFDLRQEVERLLGAREHVPEWLSTPLLGADNAALLEGHATVTQPGPEIQVRFHPGVHFAQRYCIVHSLGRGGMGEVYRAEDLVLRQTVALKFLPPAATANASMLSRFRNEVRTARQVSHPNLCRVYDIGEAEGLTYLSMEYVDGEDLASLLRRIRKLPQDKALEIAWQLCSGLAAAHAKGVIHRDLKPANIMLDSQGHVRITDFGIAGVAEHIRDVRSGTPAYMSPEQVAGKEVTARSDLYALGIVLHELLTGKRPPLEPGSAEMDPTIERVIQRCLDPDPRMRPATALSVAAALPGGDPLAAVLAKGETPSPELVAEAGPVEGLHPWVAGACLAAVIVGLAFLCVLRQKNDFVNQMPMENSSEVLAAKARDIAKSFGYSERPADSVFGWSYDTDYLRFAVRQKGAASREPNLLAPYPPAVYFWYRQSLHYSSSVNTDDDFTVFRRDALEPGMQAVVLDSEGKLLELHVRPPIDFSRSLNPPPFEWSRLFAAAGLDPSRFKHTEPELTPGMAFDSQAAWTGSSGNDSHSMVRIEAAAYRGRPVFFRVLGPWMRPAGEAAISLGTLSLVEFVASVIVVPLIAGLLAWRNARNGRGDRRGAFRLATFIFLSVLVQGISDAHHIPAAAEYFFLFASLRTALFFAGFFWVLYMAFEPQVRRRYPEALVTWSRVLAGRFRDPQVGAHVLIGIASGVCGAAIVEALLTPPTLLGADESGARAALPWSTGVVVGFWCFHAVRAVGAMGYLFLLNLISIVIRRNWLAVSIFILLATLVFAPYATGVWLALARSAVFFAIVGFALIRFGVLTVSAIIFAQLTLLDFPLTTNLSAWYADASLLAVGVLIGLAMYGVWTTLEDRPLRAVRL